MVEIVEHLNQAFLQHCCSAGHSSESLIVLVYSVLYVGQTMRT